MVKELSIGPMEKLIKGDFLRVKWTVGVFTTGEMESDTRGIMYKIRNKGLEPITLKMELFTKAISSITNNMGKEFS